MYSMVAQKFQIPEPPPLNKMFVILSCPDKKPTPYLVPMFLVHSIQDLIYILVRRESCSEVVQTRHLSPVLRAYVTCILSGQSTYSYFCPANLPTPYLVRARNPTLGARFEDRVLRVSFLSSQLHKKSRLTRCSQIDPD